MENNSFSFSPLDSASEATMSRYQKRLLEQLSKTDTSPVLAEMARELLAGNVTIRQAFETSAYSEAVLEAGRTAALRFAEMPEDELLAAYQDGQAVLDQLDAEDANPPEDVAPSTDEPSGNRAPTGGSADDTEPVDDGPIESFLIDPLER